MWLDRFSNNSTPTGSTNSNRPSSPLSRKSSHLASHRNGLNLAATRSTSSLDLSLASSNVSLPLLPNKPAGSSLLRQEQKPDEDTLTPVDALKNILAPLQDGGHRSVPASHKPTQLADLVTGEIDLANGDLEEYVTDNAHDYLSQDAALVTDVSANRQDLQDFHDEITTCDNTLRGVELYLTNFKAELGQVSAEIENLQARSIQLNAQLDNRRKVEKLLGPAVEALSISPATIKIIVDGPIDDAFGKALVEIEARRLALASKHEEDKIAKAVDDIKPLLDDLKTFAIERIRDYIVTQIKALRSPNINAQIVQKQTLLRHKELFPFLFRNHAVLADEITQAYANTMRWYFTSNFQRYIIALNKLQLYAFEQSELLGADATAPRRNMLSGAKGSQTQHDAFSLGARTDILRHASSSAIPSHVAEDSQATHHIEIPFRSFNQVLLDNISAEYAFATDFFSVSSFHEVDRRVNEVFEPTFTLGHELTKTLIDRGMDCLGILTCVRINQQLALEAQKRKVPVLESYLNYTNILLWPRFQKVMDLHCESLKKVPTSNSRGAVAAFSLVGGGDAAKHSVAPHVVTQRFGQFLNGILTLSIGAGDNEPVANSLVRLRVAFESLMGKLAKNAGDLSKRARFLYNNYSLVLTIIGDTQGKLAEEQKEHFSALLKEQKPR